MEQPSTYPAHDDADAPIGWATAVRCKRRERHLAMEAASTSFFENLIVLMRMPVQQPATIRRDDRESGAERRPPCGR
jgi:hypothetical protein